MTNPNEPVWNKLDLKELVEVSINNVIVDWIGHKEYGRSLEDVLMKCNVLGVEARRLEVGTRKTWQKEIENNGYVVAYHDGKGPTDSNAIHYTLKEYGAKYGAQYSKDPKYRSKTRDILVSALDILKYKRVIVDGIHRGAVMSSEYSDDSDFTNRIVYEWRGDKVKEIFTYDFLPFYR